jgi:hypothetical protein
MQRAPRPAAVRFSLENAAFALEIAWHAICELCVA